MKRFLALSAFAVMATIVAGSAMANDTNVAVSIGVPGQVYVNAQSASHFPVNSRTDRHGTVIQHVPYSHGERRVQDYAPVHVQSGRRQDVNHGAPTLRHEYDENRRHGRENGRDAH